MEADATQKLTTRRPRKTSATTSARRSTVRKQKAPAADPEPQATTPPEDTSIEVPIISHDGHRPPLQEPAPPSPKTSFADTVVWLIGALAILLFLASQIVSQLQVQTSLVWQLRSSEHQIAALENEIAAIEARNAEALVLLRRAEEVSETYNALFTDLLTLAESDPDAQAIVAKYQIRNLDSR
jgi:hypothetical protein